MNVSFGRMDFYEKAVLILRKVFHLDEIPLKSFPLIEVLLYLEVTRKSKKNRNKSALQIRKHNWLRADHHDPAPVCAL